MPLKGPGHFKENVRTLMGEIGQSPHVQSRQQALAIAYSKERGHARGGIVEHDFDPELPRRQDDAALVPLTTYPPAYLETIERLRQNQRAAVAPVAPRGFARGGSTSTKYTQDQVNYRRGYPMRQCSVCTMYTHGASEGPFGGCTSVNGPITPYGLCDIWHCEQNPYGHRLTADHRRVMEDAYDHAHGYSTSKFSHNRR